MQTHCGGARGGTKVFETYQIIKYSFNKNIKFFFKFLCAADQTPMHFVAGFYCTWA